MLFSIGLTFMAVAGATYFFGPAQQPVRLPEFLRGQVRVAGLELGAYRLFLIAVVVVITVALRLSASSARASARRSARRSTTAAAAGLGITSTACSA